jgi:hypothetical protein
MGDFRSKLIINYPSLMDEQEEEQRKIKVMSGGSVKHTFSISCYINLYLKIHILNKFCLDVRLGLKHARRIQSKRLV